MIIVGQTVLERYEDLWDLIARCQPLLGEAGSLMSLAEHATASRLEPWAELPREAWVQGRVFGKRGELYWRAYGPLLRAVLVTDVDYQEERTNDEDPAPADRIAARLHDLGLTHTAMYPWDPKEDTVFLWRGTHATARVWRYLDDDGNTPFVRYCDVT